MPKGVPNDTLLHVVISARDEGQLRDEVKRDGGGELEDIAEVVQGEELGGLKLRRAKREAKKEVFMTLERC